MQNAVFTAILLAGLWLFPDDLELGGVLRNVALFIGGVIVATPFLVYFAVLRALPERIQPEEVSDSEITNGMQSVINAYQTHGFERVGSPLKFDMGNEAILVPMINVADRTWGAVYTVGRSARRSTTTS